MRYYRLHCIDCKESTARSPETVYAEHSVEADWIEDAWVKAKADGYWPLSVIESGWVETLSF